MICYRFFLILLATLTLIACDQDETPMKYCNLDMDKYDVNYGINYQDPITYLQAGPQSELNFEYINLMSNDIGFVENNLEGIGKVSDWLNDYFENQNAGGSMIGYYDANSLYDSKIVYGCHSSSLVLTGALRAFGFPAIMVETASIDWAEDYVNGDKDTFSGHVMTEAYVDGNWILIDNDGAYVSDYEQSNPFISSRHSNDKGLFVIAKGYDMWNY